MLPRRAGAWPLLVVCLLLLSGLPSAPLSAAPLRPPPAARPHVPTILGAPHRAANAPNQLSAQPGGLAPSHLPPMAGSFPHTSRPAPRAGTAQAGGCVQQILNPTMDDGTGWTEVNPTVVIDTGDYVSAPSSFRLDEANGTLFQDGYRRVTVAQLFDYPASANSFALDLAYRYRTSSPAQGDQLYLEFFGYDPNTGGAGSLLTGGQFTVNYPGGSGWSSANALITTGNYPQLIAEMQQSALVWVAITLTANPAAPTASTGIDDLTLLACDAATPPTGQVRGNVFHSGGQSVTGAPIGLVYDDPAGGSNLVDLTYADASGNYSFDRVAAPGQGSYQVWFLNNDANATQVGYWAGQLFSTGDAPPNGTVSSFDIADAALQSPANYARVTLPQTFTWLPRANTGYIFCAFPTDDPTSTGCAVTGSQNSFTLTERNLTDDDGQPFPIQLNTPYTWFLYLYDASFTAPNYSQGFGTSYYAGAFTPIDAQSAPPNAPQNPSGSPPSSASSRDWLMMVYFAGDNNLGDPREQPGSNPPRAPALIEHYAHLKQLAASFPNVQIVTLADFYGNTGTELCYLRAGAQDCQQLGEQDTADPATLTRLLTVGIDNFPASRRMLVIADHGHPITGIGNDETSGPISRMRPNQLRDAFLAAGLGSTRPKLDLIYYNNCLMGELDALADASAFADYAVASSDLVWIIDVYERLLQQLTTAPTPNVAAGIVSAYQASADVQARGLFRSIAAYDLRTIGPVSAAVSTLGAALSDALNSSRAQIDAARATVQRYDSSGDFAHGPDDALVDVRHLAQLLSAPGISNARIRAAASAVLSALNGGPVIASVQQSGGGVSGQVDLSNAAGLSVFFPNGSPDGGQPTLVNAYLNNGIYANYHATTSWDEFVQLYNKVTQQPAVLSGGNRPLPGGNRPLPGGNRPLPGGLPVSALPVVRVLTPMVRR